MGSAVQRAFLKINDAVLSGGDELASFAEVAGMSADEFKTAWQDDAAYALIPFLEGLHETHEAGGNVNQILRELGVTSVNELNTLLVLAGGYDQLAGNLELASGAYHETEEAMMALNQEAELAYGSTLGKLRTAWNRLKDSLIDIGEPIATAVLDIVDGAEPLFEWIEGLANGFSNLEKSAQQDIIKMVGQIALIAPALKIAGGAITTLGDIGEMTSKGVRLFGKGITLAFTDVGKSAAELTTVAGTAAGSKGVGGLIAKLAGSAGLPWALGIAAAALGGWAIWKTWGEDAYKAAQQTERWGGTVSKETERTLDNFQNLSNNIKSANDSMAEDSEAGGRKVLDNYNGILEGIRSTVGDSTQAVEGFYQGLDTATKNILEESTNKHLEELQEIERNAEKYYGYINRIYENAMAENRELTKEEMDRVERYHQMLANLQAEATAGTEEQIRQTRSVLTEQLEGMTEEQLALRTVMLREDLEAVKEKHAEELAEIDKKVAAGVYSEEQGQAAIQTMRNSYHREVQRLLDEEIKTFQARGTEERVMINLLNDRYKEYGYTREEIEARVQKVMKATQDDMLEADRLWENLLKDPVTGEINTNIPETIADMAQSEETWDELHFMIHNADLDTNSKAIMAEWVEASGYWDKLEPETKEFLGDAENFIKEVNKSEKWLKRWDDLPEEDKKILGDNYDILLKLVKSEEEYDRWLKLPEEDKKLLGNNTDVLNKILSSEQEYNRWLKLPERAKKLLADGSQVNTAVTNAKNKLNELKDREVTIRVRNETIYESIYRTSGNPSSQGFVDAGGRILHNARGTDFHPGGLAVVNDQKGAMFRELVTLPDGSSFIPSGRDVLLDLPKGSKVLRAALTKMKFPDIKQYQDGVGYSRQQTQQIMNSNNTDMTQTNNLLNTLIDLMKDGQVIQMDGNTVGRTLYPRIDGAMTRNMQRNQIMNV